MIHLTNHIKKGNYLKFKYSCIYNAYIATNSMQVIKYKTPLILTFIITENFPIPLSMLYHIPTEKGARKRDKERNWFQ